MSASTISERAVRSAFERRSCLAPGAARGTAPRGAAAERPDPAEGRPSTGAWQPRRRWSVAELIAAAAVRPSAGPATL